MSEESRMITVRAPHGRVTHELLVLHGLRCGYCQGRSIGEAGSYFTVWEEGILKSSNQI